MKTLGRYLSVAAMAVTLGSASAEAATFKIGWTGLGGYSMTGVLKFADSLLGTGVINQTQISDLSITVLLNSVAVGTRSLLADGLGTYAAEFNVNFDTTLGQFVVGGYSANPDGQQWFTDIGGSSCDTVGFASGSGGQGVCIGSFVDDSYLSVDASTLTAIRVAEVPLPASLPLLGAAVAGVAMLRRRRPREA